jgi:AsmA family protein
MSLEQFVAGNVGGASDPSATAQPMVEGTLAARVKVRGQGLSVREAAATANGAVMVVIPRGKVRQAFAELMGTNLSSGLGLLATGDQRQTDIRCGIAHFTAKDGILDNTLFVLDTGVVIAQGKGTVNLRNETLDLTLKGEPKHARLVRIPLPIKVGGTLLKPQVGVELGQAAGQASVAAALGAVLTPLASIIPFLDPGLAEDANCRTLMREARKGVAGVQVNPSATTVTPSKP